MPLHLKARDGDLLLITEPALLTRCAWYFYQLLDSHSDGTHSLQRINWRASDVMLISPNLLLWINKLICIFVGLMVSTFSANLHYTIPLNVLLLNVFVQFWIIRFNFYCFCSSWNKLKEKKVSSKHLSIQKMWSSQHICLFLPQIYGHHSSPAAEDVCNSDKVGHRGHLGAGSSAGLPPILLLRHGPATRQGGLLHRLAWVHFPRLQNDVNISLLTNLHVYCPMPPFADIGKCLGWIFAMFRNVFKCRFMAVGAWEFIFQIKFHQHFRILLEILPLLLSIFGVIKNQRCFFPTCCLYNNREELHYKENSKHRKVMVLRERKDKSARLLKQT